MAKGLHTAGISVLFRAAPSLDAVAESLRGARGRRVPSSGGGWMGGPGGVVVDLPGGGRAVVTPFSARWPDGMGDPEADPMLFGAWSMGFFGPFVWPGALERATGQRWSFAEAAEAAEAHRGFVRIAATQVVTPDAPVVPEGYDALDELRGVSAVVAAVARLPGALAVFAPSGELLLAPSSFERCLERALPVDAWTQVRLFRVGDGEGWCLMDTVGLQQLDRDDFEAAVPADADPGAVAAFLRDLSIYALEGDAALRDGDTVDGAGRRWTLRRGEALTEPPRPTWRLLPDGAPEAFAGGLA